MRRPPPQAPPLQEASLHLQALHLRVSEMATAWVGGADESMALAQAADKLRDVVDHMDANDAVM